MVVSIGAVASPSQGVFYYERDGYYARDDPAHREASAWAGRGTEDLGLVSSQTAEVLSVGNGRVTFRLEDGRRLELGRDEPQLRHLDRACVPGTDGGQRHRGRGGGPPATDHAKELLCGDQPSAGPGGARDRRRQGATGATADGY